MARRGAKSGVRWAREGEAVFAYTAKDRQKETEEPSANGFMKRGREKKEWAKSAGNGHIRVKSAVLKRRSGKKEGHKALIQPHLKKTGGARGRRDQSANKRRNQSMDKSFHTKRQGKANGVGVAPASSERENKGGGTGHSKGQKRDRTVSVAKCGSHRKVS